MSLQRRVQDFKGKARWRRDEDDVDDILALDVPLELLGKPICRRSSAHLEAALHFIEVTVLPALCPACHRTGVSVQPGGRLNGVSLLAEQTAGALHHSRVSCGLSGAMSFSELLEVALHHQKLSSMPMEEL